MVAGTHKRIGGTITFNTTVKEPVKEAITCQNPWITVVLATRRLNRRTLPRRRKPVRASRNPQDTWCAAECAHALHGTRKSRRIVCTAIARRAEIPHVEMNPFTFVAGRAQGVVDLFGQQTVDFLGVRKRLFSETKPRCIAMRQIFSRKRIRASTEKTPLLHTNPRDGRRRLRTECAFHKTVNVRRTRFPKPHLRTEARSFRRSLSNGEGLFRIRGQIHLGGTRHCQTRQYGHHT